MTQTQAQTGTLTGDYTVDPAHSRIGFAAKHAMVTTVRGEFTDYTATAHLDAENPANSSARVEIKAASVTTRNDDRDAHVRNADFFDVDNHPTISFVSTSAKQHSDDEFELTGDLTIKGTTKPVTVTFEKTGQATDPWGGSRVGFEGKTKINRKDWDLSWNVALEAGGLLVSDKVTLEFDISAVKQA
jgi:polyisoprenoid-binding protein YceI